MTPKRRQYLSAQGSQYLAATRISRLRWAYYDRVPSAWYVVSDADVRYLGELLTSDETEIRDNAYSDWCATTVQREMPEGWKP